LGALIEVFVSNMMLLLLLSFCCLVYLQCPVTFRPHKLRLWTNILFSSIDFDKSVKNVEHWNNNSILCNAVGGVLLPREYFSEWRQFIELTKKSPMGKEYKMEKSLWFGCLPANNRWLFLSTQFENFPANKGRVKSIKNFWNWTLTWLVFFQM